MKFKFPFLMMAVAVVMVACSNNDEPVVNVAKDITGTYKGYTVAEFQYTTVPMTTADESVVFTANEDGTAHVSFESATWGKFTIENAEVSLKSNSYSIKGSGKTEMGMNGGTTSEYECTIEGTISGDKKPYR
ncbi:MAG: calycin-like domain-containing protein [Bacteroides sp.]|nr:calycin-like domain-containing protein [Bacteroides sp.]